MKTKPFPIIHLFLLMVISVGCGESDSEKFFRREKEVRKEFEKSISNQQKKLINDFFIGRIKFEDDFSGISGGFYCLWKLRDDDIYPHTPVNDILLSENQNVTCLADSLNFIVITETVSHKVGTYSNGGDAIQLETLISAIDLQRGVAFRLDRFMGSLPPSTIRRRRKGTFGGVGSALSEKQIAIEIKRRINKSIR